MSPLEADGIEREIPCRVSLDTAATGLSVLFVAFQPRDDGVHMGDTLYGTQQAHIDVDPEGRVIGVTIMWRRSSDG